jgi:serine protease inhibitor
MPCFYINFQNSLKSLGAVELFSPETADLSRMMDRRDLALDDIIHQAYINATESGSEAAAATVVSLTRDGPSTKFWVDSPFLTNAASVLKRTRRAID